MDQTVLTVYVTQFFAAIAYSLFLQKIYRWYNPDYTIVTVVGGVLLSAQPPIWLARMAPHITWHQYEMYTVWGFIVASIPIAAWQGWQVFWRHRNQEEYTNGK